ncbi:MAG: hypothetical protein Q9163_005855, partial [Psora crenata]
MRLTPTAILGLLAVQQAAACETCNWGEAPRLPSCQNACNECNHDQKLGLDFSNAEHGSTSFGGLNLQGFTIGTLGSRKRGFIPRGSSEKRTSGSDGDG